MYYSPQELQAQLADVLDGRSPDQYVEQGVKKLAMWLRKDPTNQRWKRFGPYWPAVRDLLMGHQPPDSDVHDMTQAWGEVPTYLAKYSYQNDVLNLLAALLYLNRDGDYEASPEVPHLIELPSGESASYVPGVGLIT